MYKTAGILSRVNGITPGNMGTFVSAVINFLVSLIKGVLAERARDKANQVSGELAAENEILEAAAERGRGAKQVSEDVSGMSDDELDKRMRGGE